MAIEHECPGCLEKLQLDDSLAGQSHSCHVCLTTLQVPGKLKVAAWIVPNGEAIM